jgi:hypothetical protein
MSLLCFKFIDAGTEYYLKTLKKQGRAVIECARAPLMLCQVYFSATDYGQFQVSRGTAVVERVLSTQDAQDMAQLDAMALGSERCVRLEV